MKPYLDPSASCIRASSGYGTDRRYSIGDRMTRNETRVYVQSGRRSLFGMREENGTRLVCALFVKTKDSCLALKCRAHVRSGVASNGKRPQWIAAKS